MLRTTLSLLSRLGTTTYLGPVMIMRSTIDRSRGRSLDRVDKFIWHERLHTAVAAHARQDDVVQICPYMRICGREYLTDPPTD